MMSKIWTEKGCNYLIDNINIVEKEKLLITSNFSFSHNVFKSCLLLIGQNEYIWSKELIQMRIDVGRESTSLLGVDFPVVMKSVGLKLIH